MKKVVIFTGLVKINKNLVGTAIIYHHIAGFLNKANFHVSLVLPEESDKKIKGVNYYLYNQRNNQKLINQSQIVIFGAYPPTQPIRYAYAKQKIIITYFWSIAPLGSLEFKDFKNFKQQAELHKFIVDSYNLSLKYSDKVFCRSQSAKDLILGSLISLGRANLINYRTKRNFNDLIQVAPFGLPSNQPKHHKNIYRNVIKGIHENDSILVWNGGVWNWNDGVGLVKIMQYIWSKNKKIKLVFQGFHNPHKIYSLQAKQTKKLADQLKLTNKNIFFPENWVSYNERGSFLKESNASIVTSPNIPEANYFIKTRFYDSLWAELPIILNKHEAFAEQVEKYNLGLVLFDNQQQAAQQIIKFIKNTKLQTQIKKNINQYKQGMSWQTTLKPVIDFCNQAKPALDKINSI